MDSLIFDSISLRGTTAFWFVEMVVVEGRESKVTTMARKIESLPENESDVISCEKATTNLIPLR
jgi:hypothetical protein